MTTRLVAGMLAAFLSIPASLSFAQRTTAQVLGIVTDTSGAVVPGAAVVFSNQQTGVEQKVQTNQAGEFAADFLPRGRYVVVVDAPGFKTFRSDGPELAAGQQVRYPVTLELGQVSEEVSVTAEALLLQNASATLRDSVTTEQVRDLPQARRDFTQLLTLQAGVARSNTEFVQINGLAGIGITVTVDGVDASGDTEGPSLSNFQGLNYINVLSQEAIQEVSVSKGVISAEVGRTFSGNINLITKSGTNQVHGTVFDNWQNDALNARYALLAPTAPKPQVRFNQFGGSLGGPVIRDKAFFFAAYEGYRQDNATIVSGQVPTAELEAQAIAAVPAYRTALDLLPTPTESYAAGATSAFFQGTGANQARDNHFVVRGDYNLSAADRLSARYTRGRPSRTVPTIIEANPMVMDYATNSANLSWVHAGTTWTMETRVGFNRNDARRENLAYSTGNPGIELQGQWAVGAELLTNSGHTYSVEEVVSKLIGRHTLKVGGTYFVQAPGRFDEEIPVFRYGSTADLLANRPNRAQFTFGVPRFFGRSWNAAGFIQDDFRISTRLVANLGVRYEYYSVFKDEDGLILNPGSEPNAYTDPPVFRPADSMYQADRNNLMPRVGLVWTADASGKTVVRGGFGSTVGPLNLRHFYTLVAYDPQVVFRYRFTGADISRLNLAYPLTNEQMISVVRNEVVPRSFEIWDENNPNPTALQWTIDIQRQLSSTLTVQTGYVGTRGSNITMAHRSNQPDRITGVRPFPNALESLYKDASDESRYHGWQSALRKRLSNHLTFNVSYTLSRTRAISQGDYWGGADAPVQDETNPEANWGAVNQDRTHRLTADAVYELPAGRWSSGGSVAGALLGGWKLAGVFSTASGAPIAISQSSTYVSSRPDITGADPILNGSDRFLYLNRDAFALVPIVSASGAPLRPGNLEKNAVRGPGFWNVDLSLIKDVRIARYAVTIRADVFNAFNNVQLANPIAELTNADFGRIRTVGAARSMQLGVKFAF